MRVIVTGSYGQLGQELLNTAPDNWDISALPHSNLDICDIDSINKCFAEIKPKLVINAAAYTAVDKAEDESMLAFRVNSQGPENLAKASVEYNTRLIHISTDFVFDGDSNHPYKTGDDVNPMSVYGSSKLEGEQKLMANCPDNGIIIRTSWLYSKQAPNFVKTMLNLMQNNKNIKVVSDQIGCPTWSKSLAEIIWKFAERPDTTGIYHWSDAGTASWYDFAHAIYEEALILNLLIDSVEIIPITTKDYPTAAKRPAYSVLDTSETCNIMGIKPEHWRTSLRSMLLELKDPLNA